MKNYIRRPNDHNRIGHTLPYNHHNNHSNNSPLPGQLRKASSAAALDMRGGRGGDFGGSSNHLRVPSVTRSKTFSAGPHSSHVMYSPPKVRDGKVHEWHRFRQPAVLAMIITASFEYIHGQKKNWGKKKIGLKK